MIRSLLVMVAGVMGATGAFAAHPHDEDVLTTAEDGTEFRLNR